MDYAYNLQIIPIICKSDHNPHEHELLALHQVRSFKRKTKKTRNSYNSTKIRTTHKYNIHETKRNTYTHIPH